MQTTLLGLAIAVILALLSALVGPLFVDWNDYRAEFEREASRLVGLPVRVSGAIDLRLLPTPSLQLNGVRIGKPGDDALQARTLGIEIALGALARGELRASQVALGGPQLTLVMAKDGRIELPAGAFGFDGTTLAADHLNVEDARLILVHAASGGRHVLDKLWFRGDVRSLAGSFRGEGAFVVGAELFGYRVSAARQGGGDIKARFSLDRVERALSVEGDGVVAWEADAPKFEGAVTFSRAAGTVLAGGRAVAHEPWRLTSRLTARSVAVQFEQIEFQYGSDERALKLGGRADFALQDRIRLDGALSAPQLDLDRLIATQGSARRTPYQAVVMMAESFGEALRPPFPVRLTVGIDSMTLSGSPLQAFHGDLSTDGAAWRLDRMTFRAPGLTEVALTGRAGAAATALRFDGTADVNSANPRQLLAWLEGRDFSGEAGFAKTLHLNGSVTLSGTAVAVERLKAEIDRKALTGRLAYVWPAGERKARLEAALTAAELDLDALLEFGKVAYGGGRMERPGEIALALEIGRARFGGIEAQNAQVRLTYDQSGLAVQRLSLADLGGASLEASGRIDMTSQVPRGNIALDFDGRDLSGLSALVARFAPAGAQPIRRVLDRLGSARLKAHLDVGEVAATGGPHSRLALEGRSAGLRFSLTGGLTGSGTDLWGNRVSLDVQADADDGAQFFALAGLALPGGHSAGPGRVSVTLDGPLDGEMRLRGNAVSSLLEVKTDGRVRPFTENGLAGTFDVSVDKAAFGALLGIPAGDGTMSAKMSVSGRSLTFEKLAGKIAAAAFEGRGSLELGELYRIHGELAADRIVGTAVLAAVVGATPQRADALWSAEAFRRGPVAGLNGGIAIRAAHLTLAPGVTATDAKAMMRITPNEVAFEDFKGMLNGGRVAGELALRAVSDGVAVKGRLDLKEVEAAVLPFEGHPVSGRFGLQIDFEGSGRSPRALVGSLGGNGAIAIEGAKFAGLHPGVFVQAIRAADQAPTLDAAKLAAVARQALDAGSLDVAHGDGVLTMANGQLRMATMVARAEGAEFTATGHFDIATGQLDSRIALAGAQPANAAGRPEIAVTLRGPVLSPKRAVDVSSLTGWLAFRAVEQQAKKLEAIERSRALPSSASPDGVPPADRNVGAPRPLTTGTDAAATPRASPLPPPIELAPSPGLRPPQDRRRPQAKNPPADGRTF